MKKWMALFGFALLCIASGAGAQTLLSNLSLSGSATANTTASDYRYTRHIRGGSGRGGHGTVYYSWDPYTDETINQSLAMVLGGSSGNAAAAGKFYAPTYSAAASGTTSVSNLASSAVFTTTYNASTTINTPQVAHQRVTAAAKAGSTFYFTLTAHADVTIVATGSANGGFALYGPMDEGVGEILVWSGPGTVSTIRPLGPGNYWITSSTGGSALQDTQLNIFTNPGTTDAGYSFTVTFTKKNGDD